MIKADATLLLCVCVCVCPIACIKRRIYVVRHNIHGIERAHSDNDRKRLDSQIHDHNPVTTSDLDSAAGDIRSIRMLLFFFFVISVACVCTPTSVKLPRAG